MRLEAAVPLVLVVLAGCASQPAPAPPTAEEIALAYSPAAEVAPDETPTDDDRQSRPADARPAPSEEITPARWEGATDELVCIGVPGSGCAGIVRNHDDRHAVGVDGRVWRVRFTITWDAVDEATRSLEIRAGSSSASGPSPLVLEVPYRSEERGSVGVTVSGIEEGVVIHLPSQPFKGLAEFNA